MRTAAAIRLNAELSATSEAAACHSTPVIQYDINRLAASKQALPAVMLLTATLILGSDLCAHSILAIECLQQTPRLTPTSQEG